MYVWYMFGDTSKFVSRDASEYVSGNTSEYVFGDASECPPEYAYESINQMH